MTKTEKKDVYQIITDRVLALLDAGTIPWVKTWECADLPKNLVSKHQYRGINVWILGAMGYRSPYWVTFKQCDQLGGSIKKGEKGLPVVFWNWFEKDVENDEGETEKKKIPFLRYYTVFNVEQCVGLDKHIPVADESKKFNPIDACEKIVAGYPDPKVPIEHGGDRAAYSWSLDQIRMPFREGFINEAAYYSTLFHEMIHSTGHTSRLARKIDNRFGDEKYSQEELVAEMGAAYLCGITGISQKTLGNTASYIEHWRQQISADKKLVVMAAAQAQKAVDWILPTAETGEEENVAQSPAEAV